MAYKIYIDKEHYHIMIQGSAEEIRMWFNAIDSVLTKGTGQQDMKDKLDNLEKIIDPIRYNPSHYQRIYVSNNYLLYLPNVSFEARPFHFKIIQKLFEDAKKIVKENEIDDLRA